MSETQAEGAEGAAAVPDQAAIEAEAREVGWVPKDQFRGPVDRWTDAKEFLDYAGKAVPALKATNRRLSRDMEDLRRKNAEYDGKFKAQEATLKVLSDNQVTAAVTDLKEQQTELQTSIDAAIERNDLKEYNRLRDELDLVKEKIRNPPKPAVDSAAATAQAGPVDVMNSPEYRQFEQDNPWFKDNSMMAAAAVAAMAELNKRPEAKTMSLSQKFAHVETETKKAFGMATARRDVKVDGGGGGGNTGGDGGRSYHDLPPDAKEACNSMASRFVGKGKIKTLGDWQKSYAEKYFSL